MLSFYFVHVLFPKNVRRAAYAFALYYFHTSLFSSVDRYFSICTTTRPSEVLSFCLVLWDCLLVLISGHHYEVLMLPQ